MLRRNTNQRQIVYEAIESAGHIAIEHLIEEIQNKYDNISLATIYRNITFLTEEGKIKKVKLNNIDVLETVKNKHYHFTCKKCGKIIDVCPNKLPNFGNHEMMIDNQKVDEIDINLYGICEDCQKN